MEGYNKLNFIDKIRFRWRVRKQEKIEDQRQSIEHDDRIPVDKQKIINELLAERENKKNKAKSLPAPKKEKEIVKPEKKLEQYKVPASTIKSPIEMEMECEEKRLEQLLNKELKSEKDAYENIVDLQTFLSYPHDYLPNAQSKINEKLAAIHNTLGADILNKGMQIYENDKLLKDIYSNISIEDRIKLEQEIMNDPSFSENLTYLRYNPEEAQKQTGKVVKYKAVYSKMIEKAKENEFESDKLKETPNELESR